MELDYWIQLLYAWHSHWHIADAQWVVVEVNIILCCVLRKLVEFIFFFLVLLSHLLVLSRAKHPWLRGQGGQRFCKDLILLCIFFSYGTLCEKSPVWWAGGPSQFCNQLCSPGRFWRAASWPQPDICNDPSGSYERRGIWVWSCIWCWWGK